MNHRYDYDIRRPQRRYDSEPSGCGVALVCLLVIGILVVIALVMAKQVNDAAVAKPKQRHDSMTVNYTYDGETIRWYVMTDPDTGVQYVVNDRGGCSVRVRKDGSPMYVGTLNEQ